MATNWKQIDEKLIRRGELILEFGFVEHYREELEAMNRVKEGPPLQPELRLHLSALPTAGGIHSPPPQTRSIASAGRLLGLEEDMFSPAGLVSLPRRNEDIVPPLDTLYPSLRREPPEDYP